LPICFSSLPLPFLSLHFISAWSSSWKCPDTPNHYTMTGPLILDLHLTWEIQKTAEYNSLKVYGSGWVILHLCWLWYDVLRIGSTCIVRWSVVIITNPMEQSLSREACNTCFVKEFPTLYETPMLITVFTRSCYCTLLWASLIHSAPSHSVSLGSTLNLFYVYVYEVVKLS
jgi:hypothetical protein